MSRRLDVINLGAEPRRPTPAMPDACSSHGCGGADEIASSRRLPAFGEVRVNGVEIPSDAIGVEVQHHPAPDGETAWIEAARALAVRQLLLQEAERLGIEPEPETDEAGRIESEEDALVRALLEAKVEPEHPGEDECHRYYDAHSERFRTPDLFQAAHILIEPEGEDEGAWSRARERAETIAAEVGDDAGRFAAEARAFSGCPSAQQDGSLGQVRRGELAAEVQAGIEALADGRTGRDPVRSRFGWHVLRLDRRIDGRLVPYEIVRDRIADMLEARSWSVAAARYVARLAGQARIEGVALESIAVAEAADAR